MIVDPTKLPAGLSWGFRGFRIGKAYTGNWWLSFRLPFGFSYTYRLGRLSQKPQLPQSTQKIPTIKTTNNIPNQVKNSNTPQVKSKIIKR